MRRDSLLCIYDRLLEKHGPQGWWPVGGKYHPGEFCIPGNDAELFEILAGAVLTQGTAWRNAAMALEALRREDLLSAREIASLPAGRLARRIRSSRFPIQKARKLKELASFHLARRGREPSRQELLAVWGIGEETADSILLYAFRRPVFVIDAYTRRLFGRLLGLAFRSYTEWQAHFHAGLEKDHRLFNEYHALIVAEEKPPGR